MRVKYEFDLERDSCAACPLMTCDDFGLYQCAITDYQLGYDFITIFHSKRSGNCPVQIIEEGVSQTMASEGYMKMLEDKWKDQLPAGYKLKFVENVNENGETVLTPQIVKEVAANEKL